MPVGLTASPAARPTKIARQPQSRMTKLETYPNLKPFTAHRYTPPTYRRVLIGLYTPEKRGYAYFDDRGSAIGAIDMGLVKLK
jgi:hypothetical protein